MASLNSWNNRYGGAAGATQGVSAGASRGTGTCVKAPFCRARAQALSTNNIPPGMEKEAHILQSPPDEPTCEGRRRRPTMASLRMQNTPTNNPATAGIFSPTDGRRAARRLSGSPDDPHRVFVKEAFATATTWTFIFSQVRPYKLFPQVPEPPGCCGKDAADPVCSLDQVRPVFNIASLPRVPRVVVSSTTAAPAAASLPRGPNRGSLQLCLLHSPGGTRSPCGRATATISLSSIAGFPLVPSLAGAQAGAPRSHPTPPTRPLALPLHPESSPPDPLSGRLDFLTSSAIPERSGDHGFAPLTSALFLFMQNPNPNPDPPSSRKRPNRPRCLVSAPPSSPAASTTITCPKSLRPLPKGKISPQLSTTPAPLLCMPVCCCCCALPAREAAPMHPWIADAAPPSSTFGTRLQPQPVHVQSLI